MSDLQIVLIIIGALIIAGVLIVNWWQERRFHQQVESSFSALQSDALLDDPKLDVTNLYDTIDDPVIDRFSFDQVESLDDNAIDDTSIETATTDRFVKSTQTHTLGDALPEDVSIGAAYSQLTNTIPKVLVKELAGQDSEPHINKNPDLSADIKPAQHDDIKAIFEEAFSHPNKAAASYEQSQYEQAKFEKTKIEAEYNAVQAKSGQDVIKDDMQEPALSLPAMLHAQMDLTAVLYLVAETSVSKLSSALMGLLDGYDKPVFVHVLSSDKQWYLLEDATPKLQVSRIACSLQLADRAGAVSRHTLNSFQLAVETIGLDINAHVEWQSAGDALTTATALDTFCIEVDKTIGFHLVHGENGAFTGTKLRGLAEAQGLTLASDGTFKYFDEISNKQPSFVMFNRDDYPFSPEMLRTSVVKGVTFQLDIPHVKQCTEAFSHMVQVARQMEIGLNALLVDDNNKVLGDMQIEKIRQQLKVIHATMLVRGIVPGSDSALRLFS